MVEINPNDLWSLDGKLLFVTEKTKLDDNVVKNLFSTNEKVGGINEKMTSMGATNFNKRKDETKMDTTLSKKSKTVSKSDSGNSDDRASSKKMITTPLDDNNSEISVLNKKPVFSHEMKSKLF